MAAVDSCLLEFSDGRVLLVNTWKEILELFDTFLETPGWWCCSHYPEVVTGEHGDPRYIRLWLLESVLEHPL